MRKEIFTGFSEKTGAWFVLACLLLLAVGHGGLSAEETRHRLGFHAELDMYLGLKAGIEYRIADHFGVRGALGITIINPAMFSYTLVGIWHIMKPEQTFQLDLQAGLIQATMNFIEPAPTGQNYYWVPGACLAVGFRTKKGHHFRARGGVGASIGYDLGVWQPVSVMPNAAIEYGFSAY